MKPSYDPGSDTHTFKRKSEAYSPTSLPSCSDMWQLFLVVLGAMCSMLSARGSGAQRLGSIYSATAHGAMLLLHFFTLRQFSLCFSTLCEFKDGWRARALSPCYTLIYNRTSTVSAPPSKSLPPPSEHYARCLYDSGVTL